MTAQSFLAEDIPLGRNDSAGADSGPSHILTATRERAWSSESEGSHKHLLGIRRSHGAS